MTGGRGLNALSLESGSDDQFCYTCVAPSLVALTFIVPSLTSLFRFPFFFFFLPLSSSLIALTHSHPPPPPGQHSKTAMVLVGMVIPGSATFLFFIYLLQAGHTTLSAMFFVGYLICAVLQVRLKSSCSCGLTYVHVPTSLLFHQ